MSDLLSRYNFNMDTFNKQTFGEDYYNTKLWIPYSISTIKISESGYVTPISNLKNDGSLYYKLFNHVYDIDNNVIVLILSDFNVNDDVLFINSVPVPLIDRYSCAQEGEYCYFSIPKEITIPDELMVFRKKNSSVNFKVCDVGDTVITLNTNKALQLFISYSGNITDNMSSYPGTIKKIMYKTLVITINQPHLILTQGEGTNGFHGYMGSVTGITNPCIFGYGGIPITMDRIVPFNETDSSMLKIFNKFMVKNVRFEKIYIPYYRKPNPAYSTYYEEFLSRFSSIIYPAMDNPNHPVSLAKNDMSSFLSSFYSKFEYANCKESEMTDELKELYKVDLGLYEKMIINQFKSIHTFSGNLLYVITSHTLVNDGKTFTFPKVMIKIPILPGFKKKYQLFIDNKFFHGKPLEILENDTLTFLIGVEVLFGLEDTYKKIYQYGANHRYQIPYTNQYTGESYWKLEDSLDSACTVNLSTVISRIREHMNITVLAKDESYKVYHTGFNMKSPLGMVQIPFTSIPSTFNVYFNGFLLDGDEYSVVNINNVSHLRIDKDVINGENLVSITYHDNSDVSVYKLQYVIDNTQKVFENPLSAIGDEIYIEGLYVSAVDLYTPSSVHNVLKLLPNDYAEHTFLYVTVVSYLNKSMITEADKLTDYRYQLINKIVGVDGIQEGIVQRVHNESKPADNSKVGYAWLWNKYACDNEVEGYDLDKINYNIENPSYQPYPWYTYRVNPEVTVISYTMKAGRLDSDPSYRNFLLSYYEPPRPSFRLKYVGGAYRLYVYRARKTSMFDLYQIKYEICYTVDKPVTLDSLTKNDGEYILLSDSTKWYVNIAAYSPLTGEMSASVVCINPLSTKQITYSGDRLMSPTIHEFESDNDMIVVNPYDIVSIGQPTHDSTVYFRVIGPNIQTEFKAYTDNDTIFLSEHFRYHNMRNYDEYTRYINENGSSQGQKVLPPTGRSGVINCNAKNKQYT